MNRIILSILLVACFCDSFARDYYVGGAGASDNNPGTAAQPFATIQKAASVAVAGDIVTIRSGTYRETIVPANSGTPGNPIVFQAESGATVVINGNNPVTSAWTVHSGNIYKTTVTLPTNGYALTMNNNTTILANQVFKNNVMMFEARWPDISNLNDLLDKSKTRSIANMVSFGATSLTDNGLPSVPGGLSGGKVWINGWFITTTRTISSHSGNTINYGAVNDAKFRKNYYVTGKLGLLSTEKEWHYEGNTLYFWQPGGGPPTGVEYKARNWGFDLTNKSGITIKGLQFFACVPMHGNAASSNTTIDGIVARYINHSFLQEGHDVIYYNAKQTGIKLVGDNCVIKNSDIQYSSSQAIWLGRNGIAENNIIRDISYEGNYGAGVTLWENTPNQKITRNTMYRMGRSAIDFGPTGPHYNVEISYNDLHTYGMLNVDLGAIYGARGADLTGTRIHHNWIYDIAITSPFTEDGIQTGLYFDQASGPTTCDHNVLWNNGVADYYAEIKSHTRDNGGHKLYNNTFASGSPVRHSYVTYITTPNDVMRNNIYRRSIVINWGASPGNIGNSLLEGVDPQFNGSGQGGLRFRVRAGSPAINAGVILPGITDGSVGAPDIGAYEYGGNDWVPGYTPQASVPPPANTPPVVSITAPTNNASITQGSPITISANASDTNGTINRVEFFNGTTKLGEDVSSPYAFVWNNAPAGTHALTAKATDNANSVTTSTVVNITITATNTPPVVSLTAPGNNTRVNVGQTINITASASDANGTVAKVEFYNGATKLGEDLTSPYSFAWTNAPAGTHSITARASDNQNSTTTSTVVSVQVVSNTPPTVSITAPANNSQATRGNAITITATASDANGTVTKVEFFNGATKLGEDLTTPYSFVWNNAALGNHTITAKATDNANAVTTSTAITIRVANNVNTPPVVSVTSPSTNAQLPFGSAVNITATASDANGTIKKVEFFHGSTKLGEDLTAPYAFSWKNAPAGTYTITAKATDDMNATTTSTAVAIAIINGNVGPTVAITSPTNNATFDAGSSISIDASATDADGSIAKVEFFLGAAKLGEDVTSPYSFDWGTPAEGTYMLTAKATDNKNTVTTSSPVQVIVGSNILPTVAVVSPTAGSEYVAGDSVVIEVEAGDANGAITKVEFFDGTTKIGEDTSAPYSFAWLDVPEGGYSLYAVATDNENGTTMSELISISVHNAFYYQPEKPGESLSSGIPRYFSPNDDGIQDTWEWTNPELHANSTLTILNQSGQVIYETVSYQNEWDGTLDGTHLQQGAYYYIIKPADGGAEVRGAVRIIR